jgi:putative ABC transport system permease protein
LLHRFHRNRHKAAVILRLFFRLIARPLLRDHLRTVLSIISIALGVSVVVAIALAGRAAAGSFASSVEALSGNSSLLITQTGGVDQTLLGKLSQLPVPLHFAARIEDFATPNGKGAALPFIGLDLISDALAAPGDATRDFERFENPIFAGSSLGWKKGQPVQLLINDKMWTFTVAGILPKAAGRISENNAIVADIGLAQIVTGKLGRLDSIAVTVPGYGTLEHWRHLLQAQLPTSVTVELSGARTDQNRKMLAAFRWNLRVLSYIALVVGAFLIYNTVAVSVSRRRAEIGILRALGLTRMGVLGGFLMESAVLGAIGGMLGLALGRLLSLGAIRLIGNTVQLLYVSSRPAPIAFTPYTVLSGLALGIGVSVIAAMAPAVEASRVPPTEAMARGRREWTARLHVKRDLVFALALSILAIISAVQGPVGGRPLFGYLSAILIIAATAMMIPPLLSLASRMAAGLIERVFGIEALFAQRGLIASLNRTSVLVGALTTAVAMLCSVGIMVGSFRETVAVWMDSELKADLYLRPAGSSAADRHPTIAPVVADEIENIPGVAAVDRFRVYPITYQGLPASLGGGEASKVAAESATYFLPGEDRSRILAELPRGDNVVVSEPFANKHHVKPGDTIQLPLGAGVHSFHVLGIYYDYSTERGFVVMDRHILLKYLPDRAASNIAVYLKPGADINKVRAGIDRAIGSRAIVVLTNSTLRRNALAIFDRTFQITWALEVVAIVVAVMGIAGALLALVIDRKRQFALLRFLGADKRQIRKIIVAEAGLLGAFSTALGLLMGTCLSLVLIFVINKQSFGWTIQFHWPVMLLLLALAGIELSTLAAAFYPARIATQLEPIAVMHEE